MTLAVAELKTKKSNQSVSQFINRIADAHLRKDCQKLAALMKKVTKAEPKMWGDSMVGFGEYHYVYATGREGDWFLTGFSPRKQNLTLYFKCDLEKSPALARSKGKFKTGKSCLYLNRLADIEQSTIVTLIKTAIAFKAAKPKAVARKNKIKPK